MSLLIKLIRNILGAFIALIDVLTRPKKLRRKQDIQQQVENTTSSMALYQHFACPFCIKTRRAIHKLNLPIEKRSVQHGSQARKDLQSIGGKIQVPCLRVTENGQDRWLYESSDIIAYLEQRFA